VFERFTDRARRVIVLAQEESRLLRHDWIGTEHLLLALMHEGEGVGAQVMEELGISLESARQYIEETAGPVGSPLQGHIPFTPGAKKALERSLRAALQLGHNYIGTEHILLGLLDMKGEIATRFLLTEVDSLDQVRSLVLDRIGSATTGTEPAVGPQHGFSEAMTGLGLCIHPSEELRWEPVDVPGPSGDRAAVVVRCGGCGRAIGVLRA
jgi:ATP-dependent Clp protease ATP-binding subunit ClpC